MNRSPSAALTRPACVACASAAGEDMAIAAEAVQIGTAETDADPKNPNARTADGSAFDHDDDGKVGGSKPKTSTTAAPKSSTTRAMRSLSMSVTVSLAPSFARSSHR